MKYNSPAIYGCTMAESEFKAPDSCTTTAKYSIQRAAQTIGAQRDRILTTALFYSVCRT